MGTKKVLDRLIDSKIFWIVLSILTAVVLWMYVIMNEQTETEKEIDNVQVVFVGEGTLNGKGFLITDVDTMSVNLVIHGSRRALARLTDTNVVAQIDVSTYNRARAMRLNYEVIYPSGVDKTEISAVEKSVESVTFTIDSIDTKMVEVKVETRGTVSQNYIIDDPLVEQQTVRLSGASEELKNVSHALVTLEYENLSSSIEGNYSYVLVDNDGNLLEYGTGAGTEYLYKTIVREQDSVYVRLPVQMIKEVLLAVEYTEGGGATGAHAKATINPASVTVAGEPKILESLNQIILGSVDLTTFTSTDDFEYDIKYPNDVVLISGETEAQVKIEIIGLESAKITTGNITLINIPAAYEDARLVTNSLVVTVRGPQNIIPLIQPENIRVVVDCSANEASGAGTRSMPARVTIDGYPEAGVVSQYRVVVIFEES